MLHLANLGCVAILAIVALIIGLVFFADFKSFCDDLNVEFSDCINQLESEYKTLFYTTLINIILNAFLFIITIVVSFKVFKSTAGKPFYMTMIGYTALTAAYALLFFFINAHLLSDLSDFIENCDNIPSSFKTDAVKDACSFNSVAKS